MNRLVYALCITLAPALALVGCGAEKPPAVAEAEQRLPETISYTFHARPVLSERCFACHGPDEEAREADLRLDVPGELPRREIIRRVLSDDPQEVMPPPSSNHTLTPEEQATLVRWIEQGAQYEPHWAFQPPQTPRLPDVQDTAWVRNEIDWFVLARLEREGLQPQPEADPATLLRRAAFDLTGLPPAPDDLDAFLADNALDAYERAVDGLLASPHYGERRAYAWLDLARYADSDGYLDDKHRDVTPWRDWVIDAFNRNLSYRDFITWQLAGDLLPEATQEQTLATAFGRLHKKNSEAGIVFEEYRTEYVADRTNTLGTAALGLTVECARCHDHKYDPISQKDYYQLFAFFNSTDELGTAVYGPGQTPGPALLLADKATEAEISALRREIAAQEQALAEAQGAAEPAFNRWLDTTDVAADVRQRAISGLAAHYAFDDTARTTDGKLTTPDVTGRYAEATLDEPVLKPGVAGDAFFVSHYNRATLGEDVGGYGQTEPFTLDLWVQPDTIYAEAAVLLHTEELRLGLKGYSLYLIDNRLKFVMAHSWPHDALQVTTEAALPAETWTRVTVTYDGSSRAEGVQIFFDGQPASAKVDLDRLSRTTRFEPDIHTYGFAGVQLGQRDKFKPMRGGGIDEVRFFDRALTPVEVRALHDEKSGAGLLGDADVRRSQLQPFFSAHYDAEAAQQRERLQATRQQLVDLVSAQPQIMVMGDLPEPRPTHVLKRGLYSQPGERVEPGTPEAVLAFPDSLPKNRLGLARWLFHPDHPLTARVAVNRAWQTHFGRGLVATPDDFGNQGALPFHPELLDWLAVWFRESGWDVKALHKLIVTSATYRQTSVIPDGLLERDPDNVLLARGPRFRLPAELLRDNALALSGLLVPEIGGPSVYPYQPEGLWDEISNKPWRYRYREATGDGLYRRSLYTIWKRTSPPPSMLLFDAPSRSVCTAQRTPTSTPLQAVVLLNDPQFVEAARVAAERVLHAEADVEARLAHAFRLVTGRRPDAHEQKLLADFYADEHAAFAANPDRARAFLATGARTPDVTLDVTETAALAVVISGIMNTDEGVMR